MALNFYSSVAKQLFVPSIMTGGVAWDWVANDIRIMILRDSYTFDVAHDFQNDLVAATHEVVGDQYDAGGEALGNKTASAAGVNPVQLTADDEVITQSGTGFGDGRKYVLRRHQGGANTTEHLLCYGTAAGTFGNIAGTLTLDVPPSFITLQV